MYILGDRGEEHWQIFPWNELLEDRKGFGVFADSGKEHAVARSCTWPGGFSPQPQEKLLSRRRQATLQGRRGPAVASATRHLHRRQDVSSTGILRGGTRHLRAVLQAQCRASSFRHHGAPSLRQAPVVSHSYV